MKSTNSGSDDVYVATRTAHIDVNGRRERITKGQTRVRAGHPLLEQYASFFKPAGEGLKFDTETAIDRPPATPRSTPESLADPSNPPPVKPYSEWSKAELRDEIKRRNADGRDDDKKITGFSRASQDTLAELLAQDDPVPVETGFVETPDGTDVVVSPSTPDGVTPEERSEGALDPDGTGEESDDDGDDDGDDA